MKRKKKSEPRMWELINHVHQLPRLEPEKALGIPLMEIDETVIEDTFCIIYKRWSKTYIYRFSRLPTLYLFHPYNSLRRASIAYTTHIFFDVSLMIIVFGNLINLAMPDTMPLLFERITLLFYISETLHETIGRGFIFGSYAYLKNPWMCCDFIITMISLPDLELSINTIYGIQALRGIRALHLITKIPGIRVMAEGIILSIFRMYGVAMIIFLFLISVTLAAKQLFMGLFHRRCVKHLPPDFIAMNMSYSDFINDIINWDIDQHNDYVLCGNNTGAQKCKMNYTCLVTIEGLGYTSFDTFSLSLISSFRLLTQDEWEFIYDKVIETTGAYSLLFFLPVIFLGSFFLLNLMLVVVTSTFEAVMKAKDEDEPLRTFKYHTCFHFDIKRLSLYPLPTNLEEIKRVLKERDEIIVHHHWLKKTCKKLMDIIALKLIKRDDDDLEGSVGNWMKFRTMCKKISDSKPFKYFILFAIISNTVLLASEHARMSYIATVTLRYCSMVITGIFVLELIINIIAYGKTFFLNWWNIWDFLIVSQSMVSIIFDLAAEYSIFRSLRLLELIKVQQAWPALDRVIKIVLSSVGNIARLLIVMVLLMFTFAVIGNKLLEQRIKPNIEMPRWSFHTFGGSLFTVFKIFAGEWYMPLQDCLTMSRTHLLCVAIVIPFFVIGYLVILNVFTAVLLEAFSAASLELPKHKKKRKVFKLKEENGSFDESKRKLSIKFFDWSKKFIQSSKFENIIFVLVVGSCITMAFEDIYLDAYVLRKYVIDSLNMTFTMLFIIEVLLRWFAIGIKEYFVNSWMRFDFILVLLSIIELFIRHVFSLSEKTVHGLKALRALRPLRLIPRWRSLQLVAYSLVISLPAVFHVVLVVLFIWLPFAILGVHFFAGKFFQCTDEYDERVTESIYNKTDCLKKGYKWQETFYNFNHIGNSFLSLFQLALFTGWTELVEIMVDFNKEDLQPVPDNKPGYYVFVVIFVFLGAFFSLNMFVGVAVDTFKNTQRDVEMGRADLLTDAQKRYYAALLRLGKRKPVMRTDRPSNPFLNIFYVVTYSLRFRVLILIFICANVVTIALDSYNDPPQKRKTIYWLDLFFTVSYCLELAIKFLGLRKFFFNDLWNIFDLLLVTMHIIGDIVLPHDVKESNILLCLYAFRLLRVLRLLRLTDMLIDLRRLLHAMVASIPALINISILLFTLVFIYSILGMSFFAHLNFHGVISSKLNFKTFLHSYLLLFRLTTAEGWEELLESLSIQPPFCSIEEGTCGNFVLAMFFVLSFIITSNIILVNIFIAVILENYIEAVMQENDIINDDNLANFYRVWKEFDPKATQFISYQQLPDFLDQLNKDMRISKPNKIAIAYMNLPLTEERKIHCLNVLKGILEIKAGDVEDSATFRVICDQALMKYSKVFPKLKSLRFVETTMQLRQKDVAIRTLQKRLRKVKKNKKNLK